MSEWMEYIPAAVALLCLLPPLLALLSLGAYLLHSLVICEWEAEHVEAAGDQP
jgi:hypothetical protein